MSCIAHALHLDLLNTAPRQRFRSPAREMSGRETIDGQSLRMTKPRDRLRKRCRRDVPPGRMPPYAEQAVMFIRDYRNRSPVPVNPCSVTTTRKNQPKPCQATLATERTDGATSQRAFAGFVRTTIESIGQSHYQSGGPSAPNCFFSLRPYTSLRVLPLL